MDGRVRPERSPPPPSLPFATGGARPERERGAKSIQQTQSSTSTATLGTASKRSYNSATSPGLASLSGQVPILPAQGPSTPQVQFSHPAHDGAANREGGGYSGADFKRKRSLVRPDRERLDPGHRLFNYRTHAAAMEADGAGIVNASRTGNTAAEQLRRGKSILAREEGMAGEESGLAILKRGATLRRKSGKAGRTEEFREQQRERKEKGIKAPLSPWMIYCRTITICFPSFLLRACGLHTKERQRAWREKIGLLGIIIALMAGVGFLTFGFTQSVCGKPPLRYLSGTVQGGSMIYNGYDYSMDKFAHPGAAGIGAGSNPLYSDFNGGGHDGSFLFQNVNGACKGLITAAPGSGIPNNPTTGDMGWYFPCNIFDQYGSSQINKTGYATGELCHTQASARSLFAQAAWDPNGVIGMKREGQVYYTWDGVRNASRNLGVYQQSVLDFSLLLWLDTSQVRYPAFYDYLARGNATYRGQDITMQVIRDEQRALADCLVDVIRVGFIDSETIGCVASSVVLYVSLIFIIGVVAIKFGMAVIFGWFLSWRLGSFRGETIEQRRARAAEIERWTDNIYSAAPKKYHPNVKQSRKSMLPTKSRFSVAPNSLKPPTLPSANSRQSLYGAVPGHGYSRSNATSLYGAASKPMGPGMRNSPPGSPGHSSTGSLTKDISSRRSSMSLDGATGFSTCPFPLDNVVPQPSKDFEPFNFPLAHAICLVTAYSESTEGLRTTLDSLATTDYPNSHKLIMVIADGMVKGSGNTATTPEICLTMMKDFVVPKDEVQPHSYVAIADGHKRHNMAKVYAGFYDYDSATVESSKQQRVPMILVAKVGNPLEAHDAKPGNRGKRDSQVLLMAFLQKVIFDERMTTMEYEFFNSIWRCTGVSPDQYEVVLMVDADTKVFPDSLTRMTACMVNDPEIMGLCGETKIANKGETWVTMIQVFEYYISHHLTKAFESMFGGVTCLPGCFSMYRIKSPKGYDSYWVPILANPDIVEHYSENVVDTLHKKNLLLLGEDRYLTTLMLKTFPKRKMMFCPQAVCKTVVPDTFRILLSQRRRWINSTIHNLFELLLVRDLCGTFCFSMQFVVGMELAGTLVLPAAIAFTIYLLVITAIPGTEKPIIPLILLGIILGLPGILIVVTSRRLQYVGWMGIYLLSLPIWNFVLPAYAYLHMDDFSWGQTRKVLGEKKNGVHGDKEGEFDSSHIVMKRWAEFERDRRWKAGAHARESTYDVLYRSSSPGRSQSNRQSIISSAETSYYSQPHANSTQERLIMRDSIVPSLPVMGHVPPGMADAETVSSYHTGPRILEVPAPLAPQTSGTPPMGSHSPSYRTSLRSSPDIPPQGTANPFDGSVETLGSPLPGVVQPFTRNYGQYGPADDEERQAMLSGPSSPMSPDAHPLRFGPAYTDEPDDIRLAGAGEHEGSRGRTESATGGMPAARRQSRGVSLVDTGPVAGAGGEFRTVQRTRRPSSTAHTARRSDVTAAIAAPPSTHTSPLLPSTSPFQSPTPPQLPHPMSPQQLEQQHPNSAARPSLPPGAAPARWAGPPSGP